MKKTTIIAISLPLIVVIVGVIFYSINLMRSIQPQQGQVAQANFGPMGQPPQNPGPFSGPGQKMKLPSEYQTGVTWNQAVEQKKPIAVNFYVNWCHYCQGFAPKLDNLRKEYQSKMNFVTINVEDPQNKKMVEDFSVNGFPTLYLVNPKNDYREFVSQRFYSDPDKMKEIFDKFLKGQKSPTGSHTY